MKNKVAGYLKILGIVLFVLSVFGSLSIANKKVTELKESTISSKYDRYETKTVFDGTLFFTSLISSTIGCSLIYAFGELIDVIVDGNSINLKNDKRNDELINK